MYFTQQACVFSMLTTRLQVLKLRYRGKANVELQLIIKSNAFQVLYQRSKP